MCRQTPIFSQILIYVCNKTVKYDCIVNEMSASNSRMTVITNTFGNLILILRGIFILTMRYYDENTDALRINLLLNNDDIAENPLRQTMDIMLISHDIQHQISLIISISYNFKQQNISIFGIIYNIKLI